MQTGTQWEREFRKELKWTVASQSALYNGNWGPEGGQKGGEIFEFE
jgi:hypothetical protein